MKRENLEKAKNAIEQAQHIEYVIGCINNDPTCVIRGWDWVPRDVNSTYVERILLNLTDHEKICLEELKGAMTIICKQAAERTLANINAQILEM